MTLQLTRHKQTSPADLEGTLALDRYQVDAELVARAQRNPQAFGEVFQRYHRDVFAYCFRRLGDPDAADDAASTVFVKAFAALDRFRPQRGNAGVTFRSWLFSIAHNVVVDAWRRDRRHLPLDGPDDTDLASRLVDPGATPEDIAIGAEEARRVISLLQRLPERQRAVVELRLAGLTTSEVAHALGMSLPAAKSMQFRGYSALRDLLREDPGAISREIPI